MHRGRHCSILEKVKALVFSLLATIFESSGKVVTRDKRLDAMDARTTIFHNVVPTWTLPIATSETQVISSLKSSRSFRRPHNDLWRPAERSAVD